MAVAKRTPDEILAVLDQAQFACNTTTAFPSDSFDLRSLMWEIIEDVRESYGLAMADLTKRLAEAGQLIRPDGTVEPGYENLAAITLAEIVAAWNRADVEQTVEDYLANHYGDD